MKDGGGGGRLAALVGGVVLLLAAVVVVALVRSDARSEHMQLGDRDLPRRGVNLPRAGLASLPAHRCNTFEVDTGLVGGLYELHRWDDEGRFRRLPWPAVT